MSIASLLFLADGRFPDGTHAHSHGLEYAIDAGRVHDLTSLADYVTCRLWTSGRIDAATARLAAAGTDPDDLDAAWCLRTPSATARATSRSLGRSLARSGARLGAGASISLSDRRPPVQPIAFGLLAAAVGCSPEEAALGSAHGMVATLSTAGLRLLSLDPFDVAAIQHELRSDVDGVSRSTAEIDDVDDLPCASTPFAEIDLEHQSTLPTRLFRS